MNTGTTSGMATTAPGAAPENKKGCLFYGCLTVIFVVVILGGIIGFGFWFVFKYLKDSYTAPSPIKIERMQISKDEIDSVQKSFEDLKRNIESNDKAFTHVITTRDVQAILQHDPETAQIADMASVEIKGEEIHAKWSVPIPFPFFGIRFFNGEGYGSVSYEREGGFKCNLRDVMVNGNPLSSDMANKFCENAPLIDSNIPEGDEDDPFLKRVESVTIKDGRIEIKFGDKVEAPK